MPSVRLLWEGSECINREVGVEKYEGIVGESPLETSVVMNE
jgi:hypothetical protein